MKSIECGTSINKPFFAAMSPVFMLFIFSRQYDFLSQCCNQNSAIKIQFFSLKKNHYFVTDFNGI